MSQIKALIWYIKCIISSTDEMITESTVAPVSLDPFSYFLHLISSKEAVKFFVCPLMCVFLHESCVGFRFVI